MTIFCRHAKHDLQHQGVGKPGIPRASDARDRWFKSSHPDFVTAVGPVLVREGGC